MAELQRDGVDASDAPAERGARPRAQYSLAGLLEFTLACGALLSSVGVALHSLPEERWWVRPATFLTTWAVLALVYMRRRYWAVLTAHVFFPAPVIPIGLFCFLAGAPFRGIAFLSFLCFAASLVSYVLFLVELFPFGPRSDET